MIDFKTPPAKGAYGYLLAPTIAPTGRPSAPPPLSPLPERGSPGRIHIAIEICDRRAPPPRMTLWRFFWTLIAIGFVLWALGAGANAQTTERQYRLGTTTYFEGHNAAGDRWHGTMYRFGSTIITNMYGDGWSEYCRTTKLGSTLTTDCTH